MRKLLLLLTVLAISEITFGQITLAKWTFEGVTVGNSGQTPIVSVGSSVADQGLRTSGSSFSGFHANAATAWTTSNVGNGSATSLSSNNWGINDYYQFVVSTLGFGAITIKFDQTGSNSGPRDFKLQYSIDGTNFTDVTPYSVPTNSGPAIGWSGSAVNPASTLTFNLSAVTTLNNASAIYLRLVDVSTTSISGTTVGNTGTNRVDNFHITGTLTHVYVNANAAGSNNGTSWTNAYTKLQDALAFAQANSTVTQIWVAAGTYYPDEGGGKTANDRTASFIMKNSLAIYGGFTGTEAQLTDRNWRTNLTILSGDIDQNDGANFTNSGGNSYHVVYNNANSLNATAVLDGFILIAGNANDGSSPHANGGGFYNQASSPIVTNCTFSGNSTNGGGGGMYNTSSASPIVTNCIFSGNNAFDGGGVYNVSSVPTFTNCSFSGNKAGFGGGMENLSSSVGLTNCTFSGNNASFSGVFVGGAMLNGTSSSPTLTNCILWGNNTEVNNGSNSTPVYSYSLVQGLNPGGTNLDGTNAANNPLFVQQPAFASAPTTAGNLRLQACSPVINKGNGAVNSTPTDLDGNARKVGVIDLGAYEYQSGLPEINVQGNSVTIVDGDATPSATDHTDFGNANTGGGTMVRTFTIQNMGTSNLTVTSITISGADAGMFTVGALTPASPIAGGNSATFTVTFAPTSTGLKNATINIANNDCDEAAYDFAVQGTGAGSPTISINDVSLAEGNTGTTNFTFTVQLSAPATSTVTVNYATADGTANAPGDYTSSSGTITFAPNETSKTLTVSVNGDVTFEPGETFFVNLSSPTNATTADGQGEGTITNDDVAPALSVNDVTLSEGTAGTTNFDFTVQLSAPSEVTVTVNYATADGTANASSDYTATSGTLTFAPGQTSKNLTVLVNGDGAVEPDETFFVNLSSATNATISDGQGQGTITNDDAAIATTFYVDDNSDANDAYTPGATGNDATGDGSATAPYRTIAKALSVALPGNTIFVDAGEFVEQVVVNKSITITGAASSGLSQTTIKAPATLTTVTATGNHKVIVYATGAGNTIDISKVVVDGDGRGGGADDFEGVYFYEASGSFTQSRIIKVRDNPYNGVQSGTAFLANHAYDISLTQTVTVSNNTIEDYQKAGIVINELNTQGIVTNNVVTGQNIPNINGENGIQFAFGAYGTITGNTISNNLYNGPAAFEAAGILIAGVGVNEVNAPTGNTTTIGGAGALANTLNGNEVGLYTAAGGFGYNSNAGLVYGANSFSNNYIHVIHTDPATIPSALFVYDKRVDNTSQTNIVYGRLQRAIDDATAGNTLNASAGTFIEKIAVDKSLNILGANANVNPCSGTRGAETILMPTTSQPYYDGATEVRMMEITASNVAVKGFTFDGNNPALTTNVIDAADGIDAFADVQGINIQNNIFKNINEGAINAIPSGITSQVENVITNNSFDNIAGNFDPAYPYSGYGIGVYLANNFYTTITNNCMTNVRIGVQTDNFNLANTGATAPGISNNTIQSKRLGIWYNNNYQNASTVTITDNNITTASGAANNEGIALTSIQSAVSVNVTNNTVTGANIGISLWNNPTTNSVTVNGGTLSNCNVGVFATNYDDFYGNGASSAYLIKQVNIHNPADAGVVIQDDPLNTNNATVTLTLNNTFVAGGTDGVRLTGADVTGIINNNSITGSTDKFIDASAYTGATAVNAECNWYGTTGQAAIAAKISGNVDFIPYLTNGTDDQPAVAGFQPVAGSCNGVPLITYYPRLGATDLSQPMQWTDDVTGAGGSSPMNFTSPNQLFNVNGNVAKPQVLNAWMISGGSNLVLNNTDSLIFRPSASLTIGVGSTADFNGKSVTLKSTAAGTAFIGNTTGLISNAANVTVERYLTSQNNRAYRLLAPSVNTTATIRANWQEGVNNTPSPFVNINPTPGYGTHITGSTTGASGFDATQTGQGSLFTYDGLSQQYQGVANTDPATLQAKTGYLLFIRGNRSTDLNSTANPLPSSTTTLRTTGGLLTGTQTFSGVLGNGGFNLVTNPYASPINWASVYSANTGITPSYTLFDPNIGTQGGYVTVNTIGIKSNASSNATTHIQSGQAFFVQASPSAPAPTLSIMEAHKSTPNNVDVFRVGTQTEIFSSSLFYTNGNGVRINADGVTSVYNNLYSAALDENDAAQIPNWEEDIAIARSGSLLSIESRPLIDVEDTIAFTLARMQVRNYEWQFSASGFSAPGLTAILVDNFLNSRTPLSTASTTVVPFSVTANSASAAANRFMIIFRTADNTPLPLSLLNARAYQKGDGIQVEWTTGTEVNMDRYEAEESADARRFSKAFTVSAKGGSSGNTYNWLDAAVSSGANYYRIKAISKGGEVQYSNVMKVTIGKMANELTVYPNPVKESSFTVSLNLPKGAYTLSLTNKLGQEVYKKQLLHAGGSATQTIHLPVLLAQGVYQLAVTEGGDVLAVKQLIKE